LNRQLPLPGPKSPEWRPEFTKCAQLESIAYNALERLTAAIRDVESELTSMKAEHEPLMNVHLVGTRYPRDLPSNLA
jgi:hypothetical protein